MKLSDQTLTVLKNFAGINNSYEYEDGTAGAGTGGYPYDQTFLADNDDNAAHHFTNVDIRSFDYAMDQAFVSGAGTGDYPYDQNILADNDDNASHHFNYDYDTLNLNIHANSSYNDGWTRQAAQEELDENMAETPGIKDSSNRKYKEDESIKALSDYISTTYGGHYTSEQNNVQTLDLIESVGDAEAFCRSNAIKYLSRYDKKGQAKRDILKALHYSLLLYHFSGQLNETPTRGYETF